MLVLKNENKKLEKCSMVKYILKLRWIKERVSRHVSPDFSSAIKVHYVLYTSL